MFFTDCHVPADRLLGRQDYAWMQLMAGLNHERLINAVQSLGMAQRAFDDVLSYVKERNSSAARSAAVRRSGTASRTWRPRSMRPRLLVYDTAAKVDAHPGALLPREASMAKLKATEAAKRAALEGMQMMGGYGYAVEYDMERQVRAALATTIYGGTSEIQRDIIAKSLGL